MIQCDRLFFLFCFCLFSTGVVAETSSIPAKIYHVEGNKLVGISSSDGSSETLVQSQLLALPSIQNLTIDGLQPVSGDAMSALPVISADLGQSGGHIQFWEVQIKAVSDGSVVAQHAESLSGSPDTVTVNYTVQSAIPEGQYQVFLSAKNNANQSVTANTSVVEVDSDFSVSEFLVGPNPYNSADGTLTIGYQLTQAADISLVLISISGETLWKETLSAGNEGAEVGYNTRSWSGENRHGEQVATGPYILYLQAKNGGQTIVQKTKVLVLK